MSRRLGLISLLLAVGLATNACAAAAKPGPAMHCRHPLATFSSADNLPGPVTAELRTWMALHGERTNKTDSISPGELVASFLWSAQWNGDWIVAYSIGGIECCHTRLALYAPKGGGYGRVTPPLGGPDIFGDASCKGIDAVLDGYGAHR
jgi:hypothetical protein